MAKTSSTMLALGTSAPGFELPDTDGKLYNLDHYKDQSLLLVAFICNHCPFVVNMKRELAQFAKEFASKGMAMVAISSNDVETHPGDSPEKM